MSTVVGSNPTIDSVEAGTGFGSVRLGESLQITGENLDVGGLTANLRHRLMPAAQVLNVTSVASGQATVAIPASNAAGVPAGWPAGMYSLSLAVSRPGKPAWTTSDVGFLLAPTLTIEPKVVQPPATTFQLTLRILPQLRDGQEVFASSSTTSRQRPSNQLPPRRVRMLRPFSPSRCRERRSVSTGSASASTEWTQFPSWWWVAGRSSTPDQSVEVKP